MFPFIQGQNLLCSIGNLATVFCVEISKRITIDSDDVVEALPIFFGVLIGLCILAWMIVAIVKVSDDNKPSQSHFATVLEKPDSPSTSIQWYLFELEDGSRVKLRTFNAKELILCVGDKGTVTYKGQTIQSFDRVTG